VTDDVTWPPQVLWGSTVGYPSDSLASCLLLTIAVTVAAAATQIIDKESFSSSASVCSCSYGVVDIA